MSVPEYVAILRQRSSQSKQPKATQKQSKYDDDGYDELPRRRPLIRNQRPQIPRRNQDEIVGLNRYGYDFDDCDIEEKPGRKPRRSLPSHRRPLEEDNSLEYSPVKENPRPRRIAEFENDDSIESRQMSNISDPEEVSALKSVITDLQMQIKDLEQENRKLQQANRSLTTEVAQLKTAARQTESLEKQLEECDIVITELRQVIQSKEASLSALDRDYCALENDLKRLQDIRNTESENVAAKQMEINRLQKELDQLRYANLDDRFRNPMTDDPPAALSRFSRNEPQVPLVRRAADIPSAMKDNLRFGEDSLPRDHGLFYDITVEEMSDQEMRERLRELTLEKDEKERILNRVPPKGSNMSHVRRQKEELDNEIVEIGKKIGKIRLEMKKRGIY